MFVTFKGAKVFYQKTKNPRFLFLHGWGCDGKIFYGLKQNFKEFMCVDFPPFGKSKMGKNAFSIFDYAEVVKKILRKEKAEDLCIICHSFGARVGLLLASEGLCNSLVILDGAGIVKQKLITKIRIAKHKLCQKMGIKHKTYCSPDYQNLDDVMRLTFKNVVTQDLRFVLKKIRCKTLLVYGKKDKDTPVCMAKIFYRGIKNSKLVVISGAGHFCFLDKPLFVEKCIADFLEGHSL